MGTFVIPPGGRLPLDVNIRVTETRADGVVTELGGLSEADTSSVVTTFNSKPGLRSVDGPQRLSCRLERTVRTYTFDFYIMTSRGGRRLAVGATRFGCQGFVLVTGKYWYGSSAATNLQPMLSQLFPRPLAKLPEPTSIDVSLLTPNAVRVGTLTGVEAQLVWRKLTALTVGTFQVGTCPYGGGQFQLDLRDRGRIYSTIQIDGECAGDVAVVGSNRNQALVDASSVAASVHAAVPATRSDA